MSRYPETGGNSFLQASNPGLILNNLIVNQKLNGWVGQGNTYDYYQFILTATGMVQLSLSDLLADANLQLFNGSGTLLLASSSNSGTTAESLLQSLTAGSYYVRISRVAGNTSYTLNYAASPDSSGNDLDSAAEVGLLSPTSKSCQEWIGSGDSFDYYRFILNATSNALLELTGLSADANLQLLSASATLASSNQSGTSQERIDQYLSAGTYYARVVAPTNGATRYSIRLSASDPLLLSDYFISKNSYIDKDIKTNYYNIAVAASSNVALMLGNLDQNANLYLYNSSGVSLLASSTRSGDNDDIILTQLAAGNYQVRVTLAGSITSHYTLVMKASADTGADTPALASQIFTLASEAVTLSGWVGSRDTYDYFRFYVNDTGNATLTLSSLDGDANLFIYDSTGSSLLVSSTLAGSGNETIAQSLARGNYLARVTRSGSSDTRYQLTMQADADTGGNTPQDVPWVIPLSTSILTITGWVGAGDSYDYYKFSVDTPGHATLTLSDSVSNAILDTLSDQVTAGTYLYAVRRQGNSNTSYTLLLSATPDGAGNSPTTAANLGLVRESIIYRSDWIGEGDEHDYYKFIIATTGLTGLALFDMEEDANLFLFNANGSSLLDSSLVTENGRNTLLHQVSPGTYQARVTHAGTHNTNYNLAVAFLNEYNYSTVLDISDTPARVSGWVGGGDPRDYLAFSISSTGNVTLSLTSIDADANLYLYNSVGGTVLASSLRTEANMDVIQMQLTPNTYWAMVSQSDNDATNYGLYMEWVRDGGGNNFTTAENVATLTGSYVALTGWVGNGDEIDFYKFTLTTSGNVTLALGNLTEDANLVLYSAADSILLASSANHGGAEELIQRLLPAGTYLAGVVQSGSANAQYSLLLYEDGLNGDNSRETAIQAGNLSSTPQELTGWIGGDDLYDYYSFSMASTGNATLLLSNLAADGNLFLYNAAETLLMAATLGRDLDEKRIDQQLLPGSYLVQVTHADRGITNYTLGLSQSSETGGDTTQAATMAGMVRESAIALSGWVGMGDSFDYYRFTVATTNQVALALTGLWADANLFLLDSNGALLASSTSPATSEESIQIQLTSGTYYTYIANVANRSTIYTLNLSAKSDTPAPSSVLGSFTDSPIQATGWVGSGDGSDEFRFSTTFTGHATLHLYRMTDNADLYLFNQQGTSLIASSLASGSAADTIVYQLSPASYVVRVVGSDLATTDYTLDLNQEVDSAGNTASLAYDGGTLTSSPTTLTGWVGGGDDSDYFQWVVNTTGTVTLQLTGLAADANLVLLSSQVTLAVSALADTSNELLRLQLTPATYLAKVVAPPSGGTAFSLLMNLVEDSGGDSVDTATELGNLTDGLILQPGWLGEGDTYDYFSFSLASDSRVTLGFSGLSEDANLALFNGDGTTLLGSWQTPVALPQLLPDNASLLGWIGSGDPYDDYYFNVTSHGSLSLALNGLSAEAALILYNVDDRTLLSHYEYTAENFGSISYEVDEGNFMARVFSTDGKDTDYTLNMNHTPGTPTGNTRPPLGLLTNPAPRVQQQLASGDYLIRLTRSPDNVANYTLVVDTLADQVGNSPATASDVGVVFSSPVAMTEWVGGGDRGDLYSFIVANTGTMVLHLTDLEQAAKLFLYHADASTLLGYGVGQRDDDTVVACQLTPNTYWARVGQYGSGNTTYSLSFASQEEIAGTTATTASNVGVIGLDPTVISGWVSGGNTFDYYSFTTVSLGNLALQLTDLAADGNLYLYNDSGTSLLAVAQGLGSGNESIQIQLSAASYLVAVAMGSNQASSYSLSLSSQAESGADSLAALAVNSEFMEPGTISGWVGTGNSLDFYQFIVSATSRVSLLLTDLQGDANLVLLSGTTTLASSSRSGTNPERIDQQLSLGTYFVRVARTPSSTTSYSLAMASAADGDNNTPRTTALLLDTVNGWVGSGDGDDYYVFYVNKTGNITLNLANLAENADLFLYKMAGNSAIASATTTGSSDTIFYQLNPDTYLARVMRVGTANSEYTLSLTGAEDTDGEVGTLSAVITTAYGWVGGGDSLDTFRFSVATTGNITLLLNGLAADANLLLYNGNGSSLLASSTLAATREDNLRQQVTAGTYQARVVNVGNSATLFDLAMSFQEETAGNTTATGLDVGTLSSGGTTAQGWVGNGNTTDFYRFYLTTTSILTLGLHGMDGDANLALYNLTGSTLLASSRWVGSGDEVIRQPLASGSYSVQVSRAASGNAAYFLTMTGMEGYGDNSPTSAANLGLLTEIISGTGWLGLGDGEDFYKFTINDTGNVYLHLDKLSADANLALYDASGTSLLASSRKTGIEADQIEQQLIPNDYLVKVSRGGSSATEYSLSMAFTADTAGNSTSLAAHMGTLSAQLVTATGWVGSGDSYDYFKFTMAETGYTSLVLSSMQGDANLFLYNAAGSTLASSILTGSRDESIKKLLTQGEYAVRVSGSAMAPTTYALTMVNSLDLGTITAATSETIEDLNTADPQHTFLFNISETGNVTLSLSELDENISLYLYNAAGTSLIASSISSSALWQRIGYQLTPNSYLAKIVLRSTARSDYTFSVTHERDTGGNATTTASSLALLTGQSTTVTGWVGSGDTHDYYKFQVSETSHISLLLDNLSADANLFLYNGNGTTLLSSSSLTGVNREVIEQQLTADTYLAKVMRGTSGNTSYSLLVSSEAETAGITPQTAVMTTTLTDIPISLTGWVGNRDTYDYFKFIVATLGNVTLTLAGLEADANLALFNGAGTTQLAISQNPALASDTIQQQLTAGTYLARVSRPAASNTDYTLGMFAWEETASSVATLTNLPTLVSGWVGSGNTYDAYPFVLTGTGAVTLALTGLEANADLQLYNATATTLLAISTLTGTLDDVIQYQLGRGTYQARVVRSGSSNSQYSLSLAVEGDSDNLAVGILTSTSLTQSGWVGNGDSYDNYQFTVSQAGDISLTLSNMVNNANLQLFSASNSLLASSSLAGIANETIQYGLTPGSYVAQVVRGASTNTSYILSLAGYGETGSDSLTSASTLGFLTSTPLTLTGWVGGGDSVDYYRFSILSPGNAILSLSNLSADANLFLYDGTSGTLLSSSTLTQASSETIGRQLNVGNYVVGVARGSGTSSRYLLTMLEQVESGGNTLEAAPSSGTLTSVGQTVTGWVGAGDSDDYFRFVMGATGTTTLTLSGLAADANLFLHQVGGSVLLSSTLSGVNNELIASQLTPGTYYAHVARSSSFNTVYTLSMSSTVESGGTQVEEGTMLGDIAPDQIRNGFVSPEDMQDIYMFSIGETSNTTLLLSGLSDNADLRLYNQSTLLLASSIGLDALAETIRRQLVPGSYYVSVDHAGDGGGTDYNLTITPLADAAGDSLATAYNLGTISGTVQTSEWLGVGDSADFYRFAITRNTMITMGLSGLQDAAQLFLLDSQGTATLASVARTASFDETLTMQLSAGSYAVRVNSGATDASYQLSLTGVIDPGDSTTTARAVGSLVYSPTTFTSWIGEGDPYDFYKFTVSSRRRVNLNLSGLSGNGDLKLLSGDGSTMISYPRYNGTADESVSMELAAGSYYAVVVATEGGSMYSLSLDSDQDLSGGDMATDQKLGSLTEDFILNGWVGSGDLSDIYRFSVPATRTISLTVEDLSKGIGMGLFGSTGYIVLPQGYFDANYDGGIHQQISPGNYFIRALRYGGDNDYTIRVDLDSEATGDSVSRPWNLGVLNNPKVEIGSLSFMDQQDVYRFEMATAGDVVLNLYEMTTNVNVELLDSTGNNVLASSNLTNLSEFSIDKRLLAGTYYARVFRAEGDGSYHLRLFNSPTSPQNLGVLANNGHTVQDWVGLGDETDFYAFSLTSSSSISLTLSGLSADADLYLLDYADWQGGNFASSLINWLDNYDDNILAAPQLSGNGDETIDEVLAPGTYYVAVQQREGNTQYQIDLQATTTTAAITAVNATNGLSPLALGTLLGSRTVNGAVGGDDSMDCYSFTLTTARTVSISLDGLTADADLYLLHDLNWANGNPDSSFIAYMDHWESAVVARRESLDSREVISNFRLSAGTHFVAVRRGSGDTSYTLEMSTTSASGAIPWFGQQEDTLANDAALAVSLGVMTAGARVERQGWLGGTDGVDEFTFQLATAGEVSFQLSNTAVDLSWYLYGGDVPIAGRVAPVTLALDAGTYTFGLQTGDVNCGAYSLTVKS